MHRRLVPVLFAAVLSALCGAAPASAESVQPFPAAAEEVRSIAAPALPPGSDRGPESAGFAGTLAAEAEGAAPKPAPGDTSLAGLQAAEEELAEYDPWVGFNERTFAFNYGLDRHVIKPVAKAYDTVVPNLVQRSIKNIFENIGSIRRIINTALQGRFNDSGQELGRFVINTFFGLGGFIDAAPSFGVAEKTEADTGQTFGVWGAGPGPYLVLPLLPPLTVRDAFGYAFDSVLDPITWVAPLAAVVGVTVERTVNERSMNLELFENVEETVFDLYSAVRNGYLQRRHKAVQQGLARGPFGRPERLILSGEE